MLYSRPFSRLERVAAIPGFNLTAQVEFLCPPHPAIVKDFPNWDLHFYTSYGILLVKDFPMSGAKKGA
jgi:hypothetical protein